MDPEVSEEFVLAARRLVMYSDLNPAGCLFGGLLMSWIDEAAGMVAMRVMKTKRVVTKKFGEVVFDAPGNLGDFIEIWCRPTHEGRSSLTLDCRAVVQAIDEVQAAAGLAVEPARAEQVCSSTVVYVALDANGRPRAWR